MDRSVEALINYGAIDCWTKPGTRVTGIGITLGHGSWPIQPGWDKTRATGHIVVWPNPDVGTVRENPGRFGTIAEWKPKQATGWFLFDFFRQLKQFALDLEAIRTPLLVPWGPGFSGAGGTQRLPRAVGKAKAMDLVLTGRTMDAEEAERAGLVSRIFPADALLDEALKMIEKRMQGLRTGALLEAAQRTREVGPQFDHPEVVRAQELLCQGVIDGHVAHPAADRKSVV